MQLDNHTIKKLTSFSLDARKAFGPVNLNKLINDKEYRAELFNKINESGDESLLINKCGIEIMLKDLADQCKEPAPVGTQSLVDSYKFGARN